MSETRYEVHRHSFASGPNACRGLHVEHSHPGGDVPHAHPDMGPATYTIDRDRWREATGLVGGGRKKFTRKPSGPQFECMDLTPAQSTFEIIVTPSAQQVQAGGAGSATAERMVQQFGMRPRLRVLP